MKNTAISVNTPILRIKMSLLLKIDDIENGYVITFNSINLLLFVKPFLKKIKENFLDIGL